MSSPITRAFIRTREGTIHYVTAGAGDPVLLLHQTPRSWDEYRDVIPLLAENFSVIAMDTLGFGDSEKPSTPSSVEGYGRAVIAFLDALGIERTSIVSCCRERPASMRRGEGSPRSGHRSTSWRSVLMARI